MLSLLLTLSLLVRGCVLLLQVQESRSAEPLPATVRTQHLGTISLEFTAAFLRLEDFNDDAGLALYVTSFYNVALDRDNWWSWLFGPSRVQLERDLVARIPNIDQIVDTGTYAAASVQELTDLFPQTCWFFWTCPPKTDWPNDAIKAPDDVFPFPALLMPQGFLAEQTPGRLTAINMDDNDRFTEYIIDQSTCLAPRYYHEVIFYDVNDDGLKDIVAARSPFHPQFLSFFPNGELVVFENPGPEAIMAGHGWKEHILYGFPSGAGPDIALKAHDFDGDGVPEFVGTLFFDGDKIIVMGAPCDGSTCRWSKSDALWRPPRVVTISQGQGKPFGIELVDLNGDGVLDVLATNHQRGLDCRADETIAGRVYAIESPADLSRLFDPEAWTTRILLDGIRPNVTPPGAPGCRLAPGAALPFYPRNGVGEVDDRPWIVVGGDQSSKVWVLKPSTNVWEYDSTVIFDINEYYGEGTSQTELTDREGVLISTIGKVATLDGNILFVPVFEAREILVYNISSL